MRNIRTRMKLSLVGLACLGGVACHTAAANGPEIATVTAPNGDIARHRSFSFGLTKAAPTGFEDSPRTFEVDRRVRELITEALTQKGYVETRDQGDILIRFGAGDHEVIHGDQVLDQTQHDFGRLDIDAYDAATKLELWRAVAVVEINPKRIDDVAVTRSVRGAMATFPARVVPANEFAIQGGATSLQPSP